MGRELTDETGMRSAADPWKTMSRERHRLFLVLAISLLSAVGALVYLRGVPLAAPLWVLVTIFAIAAGVGFALTKHRQTWGREKRYIDAWSIPHFLAGTLMWGLGFGLAWVVAIATAWEGVEIASRVREYPTNRVMDVALAVFGFTAGTLVT
jgi:hypothetical protein